jgi:hypothetical protein
MRKLILKKMKRISIITLCLVFAVFTACDDILDINENPNSATSVKPALVLPQALATTASVLNAYNTYGSQIGGYAANAGGYGGFNETVSYAYTPNNYSGNWPIAYDNLEDYQYIIDQTKADPLNGYFFAAAKIMKAYVFQLLVDAYNDIPYTEALQGTKFITPKYDNAATVYAGLAAELDEAMAAIAATNALTVKNPLGTADVVFAGDMTNWLRLANTIKLRLMVRGNGKVTFANTSFDAAGFLTTDALINPGYARDNGKQNPGWATWGFTYTGAAGNKAWIPTTFALTFYNGVRISDPQRGKAMYYQYPSTGTNQLGYESTGIPKSPDGSFWYPSTARTVTTTGFGKATGALKGPDAGYPLFTAAESYFLQAEAVVVGIPGVAGTAKALFESGILASFKYLYMLPDKTQVGGAFNATTDQANYLSANNTNPLVNFDLATTTAQKIEAIITQKYIALNMVNSHEGWNEYRRTGFPKISGTSATSTFASIASQSPRADRLPTRILYPTSEIQFNSVNVPASSTDSFNSTIFWAK